LQIDLEGFDVYYEFNIKYSFPFLLFNKKVFLRDDEKMIFNKWMFAIYQDQFY
jgi:hypothetical protein